MIKIALTDREMVNNRKYTIMQQMESYGYNILYCEVQPYVNGQQVSYKLHVRLDNELDEMEWKLRYE